MILSLDFEIKKKLYLILLLLDFDIMLHFFYIFYVVGT